MASRTVLIIDDDKSFTEAVSLLLKDYGYRVHQALTGQSGIAQSLAHQPDVIIIDAYLPDMDGTEVVREIKRSLPEHPLIMISSDDSPQNVSRCLAANPDAFLPKAVVHAELPDLIAKTVDADEQG